MTLYSQKASKTFFTKNLNNNSIIRDIMKRLQGREIEKQAAKERQAGLHTTRTLTEGLMKTMAVRYGVLAAAALSTLLVFNNQAGCTTQEPRSKPAIVSIQEIKKIEDVRNGVVIVGAEWCPSCKLMKHVIDITNRLSNGSVRFYMLDAERAGYEGPIPALFIRKEGKTVAENTGMMNVRSFCEWLDKSGLEVKQFTSLKKLYEEGRYEFIPLVSNWSEINEELGEEKSIKMLTSLFKQSDPMVVIGAAARLREATETVDLAKHKETVDGLQELLKHENASVRAIARAVLEKIAIKQGENEARRIEEQNKIIQDLIDSITQPPKTELEDGGVCEPGTCPH